jgi:hypothetical protein
MLGPPQLWTVLTTQWCPLPAALAWTWWRAIHLATWSRTVQWREAFLALAQRESGQSVHLVALCLTSQCAPSNLIQLVEALVQERVLPRRDGRTIIEVLLAQADQNGRWKRSRGRPQMAAQEETR